MKIESPVLRRLGPVPFWRGTKKCLPELDLVYRRATEAAANAIAVEPEPRATNHSPSPSAYAKATADKRLRRTGEPRTTNLV